MKLRIRGNSLRLRLDRRDLETLAKFGRIEEQIRFGPDAGQELVYVAELSVGVDVLSAQFDGREIRVRISVEEFELLNTTDQVGVETTQDIGSEKLLITFEKDYSCLSSRPLERDDFAFPNPKGEAC